jgi:hypothetical protein
VASARLAAAAAATASASAAAVATASASAAAAALTMTRSDASTGAVNRLFGRERSLRIRLVAADEIVGVSTNSLGVREARFNRR